MLAAIPGVPNSASEGPATIDGVPTGIVYDGEKFLVSTLTGFPFPAGKARIYQVDPAGKVSLYQEGFTTLVDIALGADNRPLVLQIATFGLQGLSPNSGTITRATPEQNTVLLEGLNLPTDLERRGPKTWYVTSLVDGKVLKVD